MEFLRDYVSVFPAIVAVINGALAVFSTHYPFRSPASRFRFIVIVLVLSACAIGATFYSQHLVIAERRTEQERTAEVRRRLGDFIEQGERVKAQLRDQTFDVRDADKWAQGVEEYLRDHLGPSYVVRFRSTAGLLSFEPGNPMPAGHGGYWEGVNQRVTRLQQFSSEFSAR